jgi:hypothetical protein
MTDLANIFTVLKHIMLPYVGTLTCNIDKADEFSLNTHYIQSNKQPLWFGGVRIRKNYVSYYLMPVYMEPALLKPLSPALKKRMQGKSCFNFSREDPLLFSELAALTAAALRFYESRGYL